MCSVFVGNINWDVSEQELGDWFSQCGKVNSAYIKIDKSTGTTLGFGFVEFQDPEIAENVISTMDGSFLAGKNIRVSPSNRKQLSADNPKNYNNTALNPHNPNPAPPGSVKPAAYNPHGQINRENGRGQQDPTGYVHHDQHRPQQYNNHNYNNNAYNHNPNQGYTPRGGYKTRGGYTPRGGYHNTNTYNGQGYGTGVTSTVSSTPAAAAPAYNGQAAANYSAGPTKYQTESYRVKAEAYGNSDIGIV